MADRVSKTTSSRISTVEEAVFLNLLRTADALQAELAIVLKPAGLSPTQFNVLHILRGAGEYGLTSRDVGSRMITRDPDLTRLLDRLEARKLVSRARCENDRRRVYSRITPEGRELIDQYDGPVQDRLHQLLGHLGTTKLDRLTHLLADARQHASPGEATCNGAATCSGEPGATADPATCDGRTDNAT
ncbi:MAG TPA: MarR family transcriptional regulator [Tepidisphaeraceae bacterium]|nr:MarR family transcriptional regulator [Tepidisphaeraceae bacterium]